MERPLNSPSNYYTLVCCFVLVCIVFYPTASYCLVSFCTVLCFRQAIPVDSAVLKERYDGCDYLLGTSPVVLIRCQAGPQKPLTITVPNPSGSGRRSRPKTSTNDRRPSLGQYLRPSTSMASRDDDSGNVARNHLVI